MQAVHILLKDSILATYGQYKAPTKSDLGTRKRKLAQLLEVDCKLSVAVDTKW